MKVLIVEDDENKRVQLEEFVIEYYPQAQVSIEQSLQGGLRKARKEKPDVILLDMTIPNYSPGPDESGGQMHLFGGTQFLRQLTRFKLQIPVIVVTQFETFGDPPHAKRLSDLDGELKAQYGQIYRGAVYYHAAIHGWKQDLVQLLNSLSRSSA